MQIYEDAGFEKKTSEMVLVQSKTKTVDDPAFQAAVADVTKSVSKQSVVTNVTSDAVSEDRRSALVQFDLKGDPETATERIQPVMDATKSVAARHSGPRHRAVRRRQPREVDGRPDQGRGRQLAVQVVRHDAAHPRAHVRRARGRLRAGHPRAHGDHRHHRRDGAGQPVAPARQHRDAGDHADRPRGRRRLLAVLHPARARRAREGRAASSRRSTSPPPPPAVRC